MDNFSNASGLANDAGVVSAVTTITVTQTTGTEVFPNTILMESPCVASCLVANSDTGWETFGPSVDDDGDPREISLTTRNLLIAPDPDLTFDHDNNPMTPRRQGVFLGEFELETSDSVLESGSAFVLDGFQYGLP